MSVGPGQMVLHYRLLQKLGEGGMGVVWKAEDTRLGRFVALKFVPESAAEDEKRVERFLREARTASALNHNNICTIYDIGEWEQRHYIAMELLDGPTLRERIGGRPLEQDTIVEMGIQLADALAAAHARGIIHRDIKTSNVIVVDGHQIKVLDFGLAKLQAGEARQCDTEAPTTTRLDDLTRSGEAVGTVAYMSPEQALGKEVDARSDLFSLGVVLYEMATGRSPFPGNTSAAIFDGLLNRTPTAPVELNPHVTPELEGIINKALEKDPDLRYQSAADLRADLKRVQRASGTSVPVAPEATRPGKYRGLLGLGVLVTAATIVGLIWLSRGADSPTEPPAPGPSAPEVTGLSIAVLPFVNASGDPDRRYFSDGLTDDIVTQLSRYGELAVMACRSGPCEGGEADAREIGNSLGVRYVLQGRVQSTAQRIRVNVQLSSGDDGRSVWGNSYERDMTAQDLFALQDDLTRQVVSAIAGISGALTRAEMPAARRKPPANLDSYDCILRVYHYLQQHFAENHLAARDCLERVVEAEPDYVDGLAWLAYLYADEFHHRWNEPDGEYDSRARALEYAGRAVRLDERNQLAHAYLGVALLFSGDSERGIAEISRAVELNPNNPSVVNLLAGYLSYQGEFEQAVPLATRAIALTPSPPEYMYMPLFLDHYVNGRYEEALVLSKAGVVSGHDFREPLFLAATYGQLGQTEAARPALDELRALWTRPMNELRQELIERHVFSPMVADRIIEGAAKAGLEGL